MTADVLVPDVDFDLLYQQRNRLIELTYGIEDQSEPLFEGLINLIDTILDIAEESGCFEFPKHEEEQS